MYSIRRAPGTGRHVILYVIPGVTVLRLRKADLDGSVPWVLKNAPEESCQRYKVSTEII